MRQQEGSGMTRLAIALAAVILVLSGTGCSGRQLFPDPDCPQVLRQVSSGVPPTNPTKIRHEIEVLQALTPGPALARLTNPIIAALKSFIGPSDISMQVALARYLVYSGAVQRYCSS
jgi:hypothetical protein